MTMGYMCETHGYVRECDVNKGGQRICKECGMAVTGLVGNGRGRNAPPSDDPRMQHGNIKWLVTGYRVNFTITAFDFENATNKAANKVKNPCNIKEVKPKNRKYRRL